jgi:hypothetical protein
MGPKTGIERTHAAVTEQLEAMGCERFEIGVLRNDGVMLLREGWSAKEVIKALAWLRHENGAGAHVYVRPAGAHALTLVDDLDEKGVHRLVAEGYEPALVVETSRGNFQAWLKHPEVLDERTSTVIAKEVAARFDADSSSADWRHFGRLAGFTNQKLVRRLPSGLAPFVRLREASGETFTRAREIEQTARERLARERAAYRPVSLAPTNGSAKLRSLSDFHHDPRYEGDLHRADMAWANQAARAGLGLEQIRDAILSSRDLRHKGGAKRQLDYATRTAEKALKSE